MQNGSNHTCDHRSQQGVSNRNKSRRKPQHEHLLIPASTKVAGLRGTAWSKSVAKYMSLHDRTHEDARESHVLQAKEFFKRSSTTPRRVPDCLLRLREAHALAFLLRCCIPSSSRLAHKLHQHQQFTEATSPPQDTFRIIQQGFKGQAA